jgi:hypothetical protein
MWAQTERELRFTFADGRVFEGTFIGLCAMHGILTDASGQRRPVNYGKSPLSADLREVTPHFLSRNTLIPQRRFLPN